MKKFKFGIGLILFAIYAQSQAQTLTGAGDAFQTMNLPNGAKASALGGAFSAWADDTSAIYWNPAGMVWLPKVQVETAYNQWFQDSFYQDLALVWPKDWGAVGGRISYINLGSIELRNNSGTPTGLTAIPEDWGGTFAIAGRLDKFSLGLAIKAYAEILSTYYGYGGLGIDLGSLYKSGALGLAVGVRDVGIVTGYTYPTEVYTGASLGLGPKDFSVRLATDATFTDEGTVVHHGLEIGYQQTVFLRAGYQWLPQPQPGQDQAGLSGGVGVALSDFKLDYAMTSFGNLGLTNQVSLSYQFAEPTPTPADEDDEDARVNNGGGRGDDDETVRPVNTPASSVRSTQLPPPPAGVTEDGKVLSMRTVYKLGISAYKARDFKKATGDLERCLTLSSTSADTVFVGEANAMLGIIYQFYLKSPGNLSLARYYYQQALQINPTNETALKHLPQVRSAPMVQPSPQVQPAQPVQQDDSSEAPSR